MLKSISGESSLSPPHGRARASPLDLRMDPGPSSVHHQVRWPAPGVLGPRAAGIHRQQDPVRSPQRVLEAGGFLFRVTIYSRLYKALLLLVHDCYLEL